MLRENFRRWLVQQAAESIVVVSCLRQLALQRLDPDLKRRNLRNAMKECVSTSLGVLQIAIGKRHLPCLWMWHLSTWAKALEKIGHRADLLLVEHILLHRRALDLGCSSVRGLQRCEQLLLPRRRSLRLLLRQLPPTAAVQPVLCISSGCSRRALCERQGHGAGDAAYPQTVFERVDLPGPGPRVLLGLRC